MNSEPKTVAPSRIPLWKCILVVIVLYLLQGVTLGIIDSIPLYIASFGATWKLQGTLFFVMYPFSAKLLWAPLIDVLYIRRLGRRQTWLLPVQIILGIIFIVLSFYLETLVVQLRIIPLTIILFFIIFFIATQDICVDGWALSLFSSSSNTVWQAISQMIGQTLGIFIGSPVLLTFESANMTNKLIRQPLGMATQTYGLFTLTQFVRVLGVVFLIVTFSIAIFFRNREQTTDIDEKDHQRSSLNLAETYLYVLRLFKKKNFRQLLVLLIGPQIGFAATSAMTYVMLINQGTMKRETLGLLMMPLMLVKVTTPLLLWRFERPLVVFARSYIIRLNVCALIAIFIFFSSYLQSSPILFYILFLILFGLNDGLTYLQTAAYGAFFAYISDTRVGSTYYTLLASLGNLGSFLSSSLVLHSAGWLPKNEAYFIEVGACLVLGCVWVIIAWRLIHRLQALPVECWHLTLPERKYTDEREQRCQMTMTDNRKLETSISSEDI